jgi:hypothetical protein
VCTDPRWGGRAPLARRTLGPRCPNAGAASDDVRSIPYARGKGKAASYWFAPPLADWACAEDPSRSLLVEQGDRALSGTDLDTLEPWAEPEAQAFKGSDTSQEWRVTLAVMREAGPKSGTFFMATRARGYSGSTPSQPALGPTAQLRPTCLHLGTRLFRQQARVKSNYR